MLLPLFDDIYAAMRSAGVVVRIYACRPSRLPLHARHFVAFSTVVVYLPFSVSSCLID